MEIEVGGQIQGISLSSFLQIVHMDRTTCTLKIYSNDEIGYLYIEEGALVSAETGSLKNVQAAYEILSWNKTIIVIDNAPIPDHNIKIPLMSILMEGLRQKDEKIARMGEQSDLMKVPGIERGPDTTGNLDERIASEFIAGPEEGPQAPPPFSAKGKPDQSAAAPAVITDTEESGGPAAEAPSAQPVPEKRGAEKTEPAAYGDEFPKKRPSLFKILKYMTLAITLILMIGSAFLFYSNTSKLKKEYESILNQASAQKEFAGKRTILEGYLNTHEDSKYTADITSRLNELNLIMDIEKRVALIPGDEALLKKGTALYNSFLSEHPASSFRNDVKKRIALLQLRLDSYEFKKLGELTEQPPAIRIKEYRAYLRNNPKGKHRQEVQNLIAAIGDEYYQALKKEESRLETQSNWETGIRLAERFLTNFQDDGRRDEVLEVKSMMVDRSEFADMRFRAGVMEFRDARNMYIEYLSKNPESTVANEVRNEISAYSRKIDIQTRWDDIFRYATNPDIGLDNRIRELKEFVSTNKTKLYKKESGDLLITLQAERNATIISRAIAEKKRREMLELRKIEEEKARILREKEMARIAELQKKERELRLKEEDKRMNALLGEKADRFTKNGGRTITDKTTRLTWCLQDSFIDSARCMNYNGALAYVKSLNTGGYKDWRLPTISELAMLYNGNPYYPHSGAPWYWTSSSTAGAWGQNPKFGIFRPELKDEFKNEFLSGEECGYIHAVRP